MAWEMRRAEQHRKAALKLEPTGTSLGCSRKGITEPASDVVEDLSGTAETVAENLKVSTLAADARLKALVLISDANLEGVRVEVIGSGNLGGKNGRRRKEGRLLRGTVSET